MTNIGRAISTDNAHSRTENNKEWHDGDQSQYLGQDEIRRRIDAHDVERVDLLRDTHRSQFRGNVATHLSGQYQTHDRTGELEQHNLTRGIPRHPPRHPWALDIHLHLDADHGSDEERNQQHDADRVDAEL